MHTRWVNLGGNAWSSRFSQTLSAVDLATHIENIKDMISNIACPPAIAPPIPPRLAGFSVRYSLIGSRHHLSIRKDDQTTSIR
jgi:hypothetical protein